MKPLARWVAVLALAVFPLAACGSAEEPAADDPGSKADESSDEAKGEPDESGFPVTVRTGDAEIELAERPERIVSLSPTSTEMLFAIGAGEQVLAADEYSDYPEEAPTTDLSGFTPNVEAIAGYDPDLVVASGDPGDLVAALDQLGIPALIHPAAITLDDVYTQLEQLGVATGQVGDAAEVVAGMQEDIDALVATVPERDEPLTYYHELDPDFYSVSSETFIGNLYGLLGMESIADEADDDGGGYPQLSPEFIVEADPDVILLADAACCDIDAEVVASRSGWDTMTAVDAGRIVPLEQDVASRWGPRVVDFLESLVVELEAMELVELEPAG